ncbi:MAG: hypothetical protein ACLS69_02710 [Butyricicoccus sp.]
MMNINSSLALSNFINGKMCSRIGVVVCLPKNVLFCRFDIISACCCFLLHHAHQHAHRPLGAQFGILRVSIGYCFYHSAGFMAFVLFTNPFPAASIRVHRQSSFRIFRKGDRFPKAAGELWSKPIALFRRFVRVVWNPRSF